MEEIIRKHIKKFKKEIKPFEESNLSSLKNVISGIEISRSYLHILRDTIRKGEFKSINDEIYFFKKQKPFVYGCLKFFVKLHQFLMEKPPTSIKKQREFIDAEIERLHRKRAKNIDFVRYYRQNDTRLDKYYFVRGKDSIDLISNTSHYYTDPEFSTSHDNLVAQIIAYDLLTCHFNQELKALSKNVKNEKLNDSKTELFTDLNWTATKTDLVELIYALQASGAIKDGKAEIKKMAVACQELFNINLGNFYKTYLEIRSRKMDRTNFINNLKISLERKMNEDDLKY